MGCLGLTETGENQNESRATKNCKGGIQNWPRAMLPKGTFSADRQQDWQKRDRNRLQIMPLQTVKGTFRTDGNRLRTMLPKGMFTADRHRTNRNRMETDCRSYR